MSLSPWALAVASMLAFSAVGCATEADDAAGSAAAEQNGVRWKVLNIRYEAQSTGYWCGPASTKIALSARMVPPSQQRLASDMGTTYDGTASSENIERGLNKYVGQGQYDARILGTWGVLPRWQKDRLWNDIVTSIDNNYPLVFNIVALNQNKPTHYPPNNQGWYHYVAGIGYNPDTREVYIADPGRFRGVEKFWIGIDQLASLVAPKGYTTWIQHGTRCQGGDGMAVGAIEDKFLQLGGCNSFLGAPTTDELRTPDGIGRYNVFQRGSIYWTEATGAHEVHGAVRDEWQESGWEAGLLGYPTTDETPTPDGKGRFNKFQKGAIYWMEKTGVHSVHGRIYEKWSELNWEKGEMGYPTSSEYDDKGLRRADFEKGSILWDPKTDQFTLTHKEDPAKPNP